MSSMIANTEYTIGMTDSKSTKEEFTVNGEDLLRKVKEIIRAGKCMAPY